MSVQIEQQIVIPRGNQRIFRVGPIPTGQKNPDGSPIWYDASGHTAFLYIKHDRWEDDLTAILIQGNIEGEPTNGWFITFILSSSDTLVAGTKWMRVDLIPSFGQPITLVRRYFDIERA